MSKLDNIAIWIHGFQPLYAILGIDAPVKFISYDDSKPDETFHWLPSLYSESYIIKYSTVQPFDTIVKAVKKEIKKNLTEDKLRSSHVHCHSMGGLVGIRVFKNFPPAVFITYDSP